MIARERLTGQNRWRGNREGKTPALCGRLGVVYFRLLMVEIGANLFFFPLASSALGKKSVKKKTTEKNAWSQVRFTLGWRDWKIQGDPVYSCPHPSWEGTVVHRLHQRQSAKQSALDQGIEIGQKFKMKNRSEYKSFLKRVPNLGGIILIQNLPGYPCLVLLGRPYLPNTFPHSRFQSFDPFGQQRGPKGSKLWETAWKREWPSLHHFSPLFAFPRWLAGDASPIRACPVGRARSILALTFIRPYMPLDAGLIAKQKGSHVRLTSTDKTVTKQELLHC